MSHLPLGWQSCVSQVSSSAGSVFSSLESPTFFNVKFVNSIHRIIKRLFPHRLIVVCSFTCFRPFREISTDTKPSWAGSLIGEIWSRLNKLNTTESQDPSLAMDLHYLLLTQSISGTPDVDALHVLFNKWNANLADMSKTLCDSIPQVCEVFQTMFKEMDDVSAQMIPCLLYLHDQIQNLLARMGYQKFGKTSMRKSLITMLQECIVTCMASFPDQLDSLFISEKKCTKNMRSLVEFNTQSKGRKVFAQLAQQLSSCTDFYDPGTRVMEAYQTMLRLDIKHSSLNGEQWTFWREHHFRQEHFTLLQSKGVVGTFLNGFQNTLDKM